MNRKAALSALESVKPALATRSAIQELSYVWFDGTHVFAHNGGLGIKVAFECPLSCGVPGALLNGMLTQTGTENVEFEASDDTLSWKAGRSRVKLATLPIDRRIWRFPDAVEAGDPLAVVKLSKELLAAFKSVLVLKVSNPQRMEHHSVCAYSLSKEELEVYVSDSKSMVFASAITFLKGKAKKLAIPRELVEQLVAKCEEERELKLYPTHYEAQATDAITLYCNVFDTTEMVDMPKFADKWVNTKLYPPTKLPEGFTASMEKAVLLAGVDEPLVSLRLSGTSLKVSAKFKTGQIDDEFNLAQDCGKAQATVNAKTILSVRGVTEISISSSALVLFGGDAYTLVIASKSTGSEEEDAEGSGEEDGQEE